MNEVQWFAYRFLAILFVTVSLSGCSGAQRRDPYPFPPPNYPVIVLRETSLSLIKNPVTSEIGMAYPAVLDAGLNCLLSQSIRRSILDKIDKMNHLVYTGDFKYDFFGQV